MAAKKKKKNSVSSFIDRIFEKSTNALLEVLVEEAEHLIKWIRNLSSLNHRLKEAIAVIAVVTAGLTVLSIGVALYLADLLPTMGTGLSHIVVGAIVLGAGLLYLSKNA